MIVIIEGPDGSGKTTLCKQLQNAGYNIVAKPRGENLSFAEFMDLKLSSDVYVFDRALLTPWAYRILDNEKLDTDDYDIMEMIMLLKSSKIIYCNCENAYEYSIKRGEDNIDTIDKAMKLRQLYDFIISTVKLYKLGQIFEYDFEKSTLNDVLDFIKNKEEVSYDSVTVRFN